MKIPVASRLALSAATASGQAETIQHVSGDGGFLQKRL
jgi:hypothetical protein